MSLPYYIDFEKIKANEDLNDNYYHVLNDIIKYPDAWCYIVWSRRGPGKTYSNLWSSYYLGIKNVYVKRTKDDIDFISMNPDNSPYAPLVRDKGIKVSLSSLGNGIAGIYNSEYDENNLLKPVGNPFSIAVSLNHIKAIKGFEASDYEWITLDEFIPQAGEVIKKKEGEMVLDLYMTCQRDRLDRGLPPQKLILFANAEEISTPITRTLEVIDEMALLNFSGNTHMYLENRGILLHHITNDEYPVSDQAKKGIYMGMAGTAWAQKSFEGLFTNNDFSRVRKVNLKGYKCIARIIYKSKDIYMYERRGHYYLCYTKQTYHMDTYNFNEEAEVKRFYFDYYVELSNALVDNKCFFSNYSIYDLITRFKKYFTV